MSIVDIVILLVTCIWILMLSTRNKVNTFEFITLRCGFSIYSGWVTAATILNIAIVLKWLQFGIDM